MPATPRTLLSDTIESLALPQAKGYADFIRTGDPGGPVPCWGALAERFDQEFVESDDRKALWSILAEAGDRRALLLFLHMNRNQPAVMGTVIEEADRLSPALQRALVAFEEIADQVPDHIEALDPAARQLFEAGIEARSRERELVESRVGQLRAFRYYVPDAFDPANEPGVPTLPRSLVSRTADPEPSVVVVKDPLPPAVLEDGGA